MGAKVSRDLGGEVIPVYSNVENALAILISTNAQQIYLKP